MKHKIFIILAGVSFLIPQAGLGQECTNTRENISFDFPKGSIGIRENCKQNSLIIMNCSLSSTFGNISFFGDAINLDYVRGGGSLTYRVNLDGENLNFLEKKQLLQKIAEQCFSNNSAVK